MRLTVGRNSDDSSVSQIKSFDINFKRFRDLKMITGDGGTSWNITDDEQIFLGVMCSFNNIDIRWNRRLTYVDV